MLSYPDNLGLLLHDATRLMRRRFDRRAARLGLSTAQWRLLAITLREGRVTQARIAERLEIEPISVSRLIDRMEQAGWVARETDPADRRIRLIVPTERALAAYGEIQAMAREVRAEALAGLDAGDVARLGECLSAIIANLSTAEADDTAAAPQAANGTTK